MRRIATIVTGVAILTTIAHTVAAQSKCACTEGGSLEGKCEKFADFNVLTSGSCVVVQDVYVSGAMQFDIKDSELRGELKLWCPDGVPVETKVNAEFTILPGPLPDTCATPIGVLRTVKGIKLLRFKKKVPDTTVVASKPSAPPGGSGAAASNDATVDNKTPPANNPTCTTCDEAEVKHSGAAVVCVTMATGEVEFRGFNADHVVSPNTKIVVVTDDAKATVQMTGTPGISTPGDQTSAAPDKKFCGRSFAPRVKGNPSETITVARGSEGQETAISIPIEIVVENEYAAAIRFGIGLSFLPDPDIRDTTYVAASKPGAPAGAHEVSLDSSSPVAGEVVIGFAPFFIDKICSGHYRPEVNRAGWCHKFAPYIGLGLLNASAKGVDPLASLHLGMEVELTPSFTLAATYAVRRIEVLRSELSVGEAVNSTSDLTERQLAHAMGLVINVSPEFLKLAAGQEVK